MLEQTSEFSVVGAGISLWPNAFRALAAVGAQVDGERPADVLLRAVPTSAFARSMARPLRWRPADGLDVTPIRPGV